MVESLSDTQDAETHYSESGVSCGSGTFQVQWLIRSSYTTTIQCQAEVQGQGWSIFRAAKDAASDPLLAPQVTASITSQTRDSLAAELSIGH